jgi:hypothetical protein
MKIPCFDLDLIGMAIGDLIPERTLCRSGYLNPGISGNSSLGRLGIVVRFLWRSRAAATLDEIEHHVAQSVEVGHVSDVLRAHVRRTQLHRDAAE